MRDKFEGVLLGITFSAFCFGVYHIVCSSYSCEKRTINVKWADDDCQSLFYGKQAAANGRGFPNLNTVDKSSVAALTTTHNEYSKLPFDMYKRCVECLPIFCVDVVCRRKSDGKLLLFYRRDKPAAGIWWWPGGRMFRGETFFDCAVRKIRDETGNKEAVVVPKGVIQVWNTFFPDSNWDNDREAGREGTQTVNVTIFCEIEGDHEIVSVAAAQNQWAVEQQRWVSAGEAVKDGEFDKYVSLNVKKAMQLGYL